MTDLNLPEEFREIEKQANRGKRKNCYVVFGSDTVRDLLGALSNARDEMGIQTQRAEEAESDLKESLIDASGEIIFYKDQIKKLAEGKICVCRILGKQS